MKKTEIEGLKIIYEFTVLHNGWDMDNKGWITQDGRVWLTDHGALYSADETEISSLIETTIESLQGLWRASGVLLSKGIKNA